MTRTERAAYPRAILRDRSASRSGLDTSIRKNGAGGHNWGSIADERTLESGAMDDEGLEGEEEALTTASVASSESDTAGRPDVTRTTSSGMTEEELKKARKYRKHAMKKDIDLGAIARTSAAVSTSPPNHMLSKANMLTNHTA